MFGIDRIARENKFRKLVDGYYYKILSIDWDGYLCSVDFELINYGDKVTDINEVHRLDEEIIKDILNLDYFRKAKIKIYNSDTSLEKRNDNIYEMDFVTERRKLHPIIGLQRYCNGKEIKVLSGDLKDKTGVYRVRLNDVDEKGYIELIRIGNVTHKLNSYKFEFIDSNVQFSWESIMEEQNEV